MCVLIPTHLELGGGARFVHLSLAAALSPYNYSSQCGVRAAAQFGTQRRKCVREGVVH